MKPRDGLYRDKDGDILHTYEERGWFAYELDDLPEVLTGWSLKGNEDLFKGATFYIPMELML